MSYNPNFYNNYNFRPRFTFQRPSFVLPPPPPPAYFSPLLAPPPIHSTPQHPPQTTNDVEFVKEFDSLPSKTLKYKPPTVPINEVKEKLRNLVLNINYIKDKENYLKENLNEISETEWNTILDEIETRKKEINESMTNLNDSYLDILRKSLAKRSSKRLRLKRMRQERKIEKENRIKKLEERSRKIDENLQQIKDDFNKAKLKEEAKIQADIVLKEVLRKKLEGKKCIKKLDALLKLYKARQNTAKGRGEVITEKDAESFGANIAKLKSLWMQKLNLYEKEESDLCATLKQDSGEESMAKKNEAQVLDNLHKWRQFLFGGNEAPQNDFQGDIGRFVTIRSQWDKQIHPEGSTLPIGWVLPNFKTNNV